MIRSNGKLNDVLLKLREYIFLHTNTKDQNTMSECQLGCFNGIFGDQNLDVNDVKCEPMLFLELYKSSVKQRRRTLT